jgi:pSer/pThr/pTyr-binding forkhead associated (FHA) protein
MAYLITNLHTNEVFRLDNMTSRIGRGQGCDIHVEEKYISRNHATLCNEGDCVVIADNNSANGTYVNGEKVVGKVKLNPHDKIRLGKTIFEFSVTQFEVTADKFRKNLVNFFQRS